MNYRLPLFGCLLLCLLGCSKDNFGVKPSIRIKSYTDMVPEQGNFNVVLEYSQKKGKIDGDSIYVFRTRYNQKPLPDGVPTADSFYTILSSSWNSIPDADKAEFSLTLPYTSIHIDNGENDTIDFQFALIDLAGRSSDTVRTGKIVVLQ